MGLFRRKRAEHDGLTDDDRLVFSGLIEAGARLRSPRRIDHFVYFDDEDDALRAATEVKASGFEVVLEAPQAEIPAWCVLAQRPAAVLTPELLAGDRRTLVELSVRFDGRYDGWGAQV